MLYYIYHKTVSFIEKDVFDTVAVRNIRLNLSKEEK